MTPRDAWGSIRAVCLARAAHMSDKRGDELRAHVATLAKWMANVPADLSDAALMERNAFAAKVAAARERVSDV